MASRSQSARKRVTPSRGSEQHEWHEHRGVPRLVRARGDEHGRSAKGEGETGDRQLGAHLRHRAEVEADVAAVAGDPEQREQHQQREDEPDDLSLGAGAAEVVRSDREDRRRAHRPCPRRASVGGLVGERREPWHEREAADRNGDQQVRGPSPRHTRPQPQREQHHGRGDEVQRPVVGQDERASDECDGDEPTDAVVLERVHHAEVAHEREHDDHRVHPGFGRVAEGPWVQGEEDEREPRRPSFPRPASPRAT